ncbi:30S ribosomal protein S7 [Planctomycetes bacterium Pla163]|uniref:Small ribosomal subunit protein uS7 n=1 Tax=Rohdeia mirabilis TaxID=2528008 RepID=A0A518D2U7_9BACT|nr:30S ribosomal protein S7 [Planctomycetes bacterium Pla163]
MPRNFKSTADLQLPDPKFQSMLATKIINKLMLSGKKTTAQKAFYEALDLAAKKLEVDDQVEIFTKAIDNVRPSVEVRSKRVGGANYQVPREVRRNRQQSLAIRWLIDNTRKKKGKPMAIRLADELVDAYNGTGASVSQKETVHKMAEANKAYSHFAR